METEELLRKLARAESDLFCANTLLRQVADNLLALRKELRGEPKNGE